jgi:hypothetical protein
VSTRRVARTIAFLVLPLIVGVTFGCGGDQPSSTPTTSSSARISPVPHSSTAPAPSSTGGSATTSATPSEGDATISYAGGRVTSSAGNRLSVPLGRTVRLVVTSDKAEEVHVHGYDRRADVSPGQTVTLTFTADIPGIFEVELERSHKLVLRLEVH